MNDTTCFTSFIGFYLKTFYCMHLSLCITVFMKSRSQQTFVDLQDVLKTSSRRLANMSSRHLQDIFKISWKASSRRLQDVFRTFWKTRNCCAEYVLKRFQDMSRKYLQDVFKVCLEVVFQTSWRPTKCLVGRNLYLFLRNLHLHQGEFKTNFKMH